MPGDHPRRRALAYENFAGGSEVVVQQAMTLIEGYAAPDRMIDERAGMRVGLGELSRAAALSVEIALNVEREARLLEEELAVLAARWREEEEIAAIIDGELSPPPPPGPA